MTNLFISLYSEKDKNRKAELHTCLMNNLKSGCFDQFWVIAQPDENGKFDYLEDVNPYTVNVLPCTVRPTFRTFFEAVNNVTFESSLAGIQNINVISNSDIYFETMPKVPTPNQCFALTRHEIRANGQAFFENRHDCTDTWVFNGKIKMPKYCDSFMGIPGVDNRINHELLNIGYEMLNPSLTIKTYHLHLGAKSYDGSVKIGRPYHFINPTT